MNRVAHAEKQYGMMVSGKTFEIIGNTVLAHVDKKHADGWGSMVPRKPLEIIRNIMVFVAATK